MKTSLSQMEKYYLKQTWISDLEIGNFAMTSFLWIGERLLFYACSDYASVKQRQHIVPFRNIFITVKFCLKLNTLELQQNANLFYNYDLKRSICNWDFISSRHILREKCWIQVDTFQQLPSSYKMAICHASITSNFAVKFVVLDLMLHWNHSWHEASFCAPKN